MDNFIEMTFEEADEQFKFMVNNYDEYASLDGLMFETYGDEVEYVKSKPENRIWMYGDGDDGGTYIWSGWGFVLLSQPYCIFLWYHQWCHQCHQHQRKGIIGPFGGQS
jgi:hypothetical protein